MQKDAAWSVGRVGIWGVRNCIHRSHGDAAPRPSHPFRIFAGPPDSISHPQDSHPPHAPRCIFLHLPPFFSIMKISCRQLSACTFLIAAYYAYRNKDIFVGNVILSCFFTSIVVHRPRNYERENANIFDILDEILAITWGIIAVYKAITLKSKLVALSVVAVCISCKKRTFYPYKSLRRNAYHICMHLSAVMGTIFTYS